MRWQLINSYFGRRCQNKYTWIDVIKLEAGRQGLSDTQTAYMRDMVFTKCRPQRYGDKRMPYGEGHRKAVCGKTASTVWWGMTGEIAWRGYWGTARRKGQKLIRPHENGDRPSWTIYSQFPTLPGIARPIIRLPLMLAWVDRKKLRLFLLCCRHILITMLFPIKYSFTARMEISL